MLDSMSPRTPAELLGDLLAHRRERLLVRLLLDGVQVELLDDLLGDPVLHPVGWCGVTGLVAGCHRGASSS
jgi:hypothetical protein